MANVSPCVIAANTCDLSPTAKMPAALLSLFSLCPLLFTLPWPKDSSEALLSRLVLLCHTLQTTLSSLVRPWCPGSCDRHVSSFPDRKKHMKPWAWVSPEIYGRHGGGKRGVGCFSLWPTFLATIHANSGIQTCVLWISLMLRWKINWNINTFLLSHSSLSFILVHAMSYNHEFRAATTMVTFH